ncbi:AAA family ATPase [Cognatishimia sp. F0-27]|uniref:AAA family ATPase n=1 Tax=Cognatishimia sp. F0-27 TaxID=2816855 RepID=UPI001D0C0E76|nr:AAA family ATPase [Cognatishimia sp. F0-27]MCC1492619.1 AAA family ATPase [Cognatishimia sp. F0-27]
MRLRHLDLIRYGRFTDRRLDFGAGDGESDVTIVYGQNEAGKSTAFSAWLDLLFGLPIQHPYDFIHARKDLMVGATLDTDEGPLTLRRTGQRQGSLTDENGRVVDERRLSVLLHGLDRDGYRTRFSLDDAVLREGGEEIARAKGDLGQLLHAGSSGLSGFADLLKQARDEVDAFHKPRGRTTILAEGRNRLKEIDAALAQARLDPRRFDALQAALESAEEACRAAAARREEAMRRFALRQAADKRRGLAARIAAAQTTLAACPCGPDLPKDALARVSVALNAAATAQDAKAVAETSIAQADDLLDQTTPDPEGIAIGEMLAALEAAEFDDGKSLVARASLADADLGRRRDERDRARDTARRLAAALAGDGADPAALVLSREQRNGLREAAQAVRDTARARDQAGQALDEARAGLGAVEEMPEGAVALDDALDALDALTDDPDTLARAFADRDADAKLAAAGLPPDWRALADAGLPTGAELREAERALKSADDAVAQAEQTLRDAREKLSSLDAALEGEKLAASVVTDEEIVATRAERERRWTSHRASLDAPTADAFEAAMRADDEAHARHANSVEGRVRLAQMQAERVTCAAELARREVDLGHARDRRAAPDKMAQRIALRLGLEVGVGPAVFGERLEAMQHALDTALAAERALQDLTAARKARSQAEDRVVRAASAIAGDLPEGQDALSAARRLRAALDARRERIARRQDAQKLILGFQDQKTLKTKAHGDAVAAFAKRISGLWCADLDADHVLRISDDLGALDDLHGKALDLDRRVERLDAARKAFDTRAEGLRAALGLTPDSPVDETLRCARDRAGTATEAAQRIEQARETRAQQQIERDRQARVIQRASEEIVAVFRGQQIDPGDDPLSAVQRLLDRDGVRSEIAALEDSRAAAAEGHDAGALAEEEANSDPIRTETLKNAVKEAEAEHEQAIGLRGEARQALNTALGTIGGVDHRQARASLLEELREAARHAAETRIGLMAASGALRHLREDRRGPMLDAAERAFARMTGGEWPRLEAQPAGTGERLVGIRNGQPVAADAMSTGTRGQLYLALRVAGHADFTARYGALPFLTDDILETFDDTRAAAALSLTAEMGRTGQAIMFTHHRHLVDLGRAVIPDLHVVELE